MKPAPLAGRLLPSDKPRDADYRLIDLQPLERDQAAIAKQRAAAAMRPTKPQQPMDVGLFSDDAAQIDLIEMLMEPTND